MRTSIYNVYVQLTRYKGIYDVRIPEIFPDDCFEIKGFENIAEAVEECCKLATGTAQFNLQFFMTNEVKEKFLA